MFGGRPIECWLPAEYKASWEDYTGQKIIKSTLFSLEIYCWARNTYWVPFHADFPQEDEQREENMISYYQWTPVCLKADL